MRGEAAFIPAEASPAFVRFFGWWTREKMIAKRFFAVRLARGSRRSLEAVADHPGPVVLVVNHVSWWDPLIMLCVHRLFWPDRTLRAPMDAAQLRRFGLFKKLGTFGVDPDNAESLRVMSSYIADYFADDPRPTLLINPQGRFVDVRAEVEPRPGAARIAASAENVRCVALAMEYQFWLDQRPELLLRAEPVEPEKASTTGWHRAIRDTMNRNAAALAELAIAREPAGFECLVGGDAAQINPFYDLWLRLRGKGGSIDDRSRPGEPNAGVSA